MADVVYIWLFAMLGRTPSSSSLPWLTQPMSGRTHKRSYVMRRCRKLVACCSTAVSIILLLAGSLFGVFVDPGAARTTRSFAYQLSVLLDRGTRKDFASVLRQAASQNFRSTEGLDPANLTNKLGLEPLLPVSFHPWHSTRALVQALRALLRPPVRSLLRTKLPEATLFGFLINRKAHRFSRRLTGAQRVTGFLIDGENTSDQPLTDVKAVLIPDRNIGDL